MDDFQGFSDPFVPLLASLQAALPVSSRRFLTQATWRTNAGSSLTQPILSFWILLFLLDPIPPVNMARFRSRNSALPCIARPLLANSTGHLLDAGKANDLQALHAADQECKNIVELNDNISSLPRFRIRICRTPTKSGLFCVGLPPPSCCCS